VDKIDLKKFAEANKKAAELKKLLDDEGKEIPNEVQKMIERQKALKALS